MYSKPLKYQAHSLSARYHALLLLVIAILPILVLILNHDLEDRHDAIKVVRNQAMDVLRDINRAQESVIDNTHHLLVALGQLPSVRNYNGSECSTALTEALHHYEHYLSLSAYNPDGTQFCGTANNNASADFSNSALFKTALSTKALATNEYVFDPLSGLPTMIITHPVLTKDGELHGFINAALNLDWLKNMLGRLPLYNNATLTIYDRHGITLLGHHGPSENQTGQPFDNTQIINKSLRNQYIEVIENRSMDGEDLITAFGPLGSSKAFAYSALSVPKNTALADTFQHLKESIGLTLFIASIAIIFAFAGTQRLFIGPINVILEATRKVRSGKFGSMAYLANGPKELRELGAAFNQMSSAIAQHAETKDRTENALSQLLQQTKQTSEEFFNHATAILGQCLDAKICFIGLIDADQPTIVRTKSIYSKELMLSDLHLPMDDSPTGQVIARQAYCIFPDVVQQSFPGDQLLRELDIKGYAGTALIDFNRNIRGVLVVMTSCPIEEHDIFQSLLQVFGARITAEIERLDIERERQRLFEEAQLTATAFETHEGMFIADTNRKILRVNRAFSNLTGLNEGDVIGQLPCKMIDEKDRCHHCNSIWNEAKKNEKWHGEATFTTRGGVAFPVNLTLSAVFNNDNEITHYVAHFQDIRQQKQYEAEIKHLAYHDALTQLPNRSLLKNRLEQQIVSMKRRKDHGALLFIDLDHFKPINDTLGHNVGDTLLIEVANRMKNTMRKEDTIARLGGDEFVILLSQLGMDRYQASIEAHKIAQKIHKVISDDYLIQKHTLQISSSIGITLFPEDNTSADDLLRHADLAMYEAKGVGRDAIRFFKQEMQSIAIERLKLEQEVRSGFEKDQFRLYHQPQVEFGSGNIIGSELLLRWHHPEKGVVMPGAFISILEKGNLVHSFGEWAIKTACDSIKNQNRIASTFPATLRTSVNISPRQFQDRNFVSSIETILEQSEVNGEQLVLEITEHTLVQDIDDTISKMKNLKKHGIHFSIDDFGTGYSSLSYIKKLPIDTLKIDRSFIKDCITDANDNAIVRTIINMAKTLGLKLVAEGVETVGQLALLTELGCEAYQGFYFSPAIPEKDYLAMLLQATSGNTTGLRV